MKFYWPAWILARCERGFQNPWNSPWLRPWSQVSWLAGGTHLPTLAYWKAASALADKFTQISNRQQSQRSKRGLCGCKAENLQTAHVLTTLPLYKTKRFLCLNKQKLDNFRAPMNCQQITVQHKNGYNDNLRTTSRNYSYTTTCTIVIFKTIGYK